MIYSFGSALIAIVIGTVQALIVERTNTPGRNLALLRGRSSRSACRTSSTRSPGSCCWHAPGRSTTLIAHASRSNAQAINVYSMWGMILIEGIGFVPLTFLLMSAVLRSMDASFEEAAIMAGASPLHAFWSITLRMGMPGDLRAGAC